MEQYVLCRSQVLSLFLNCPSSLLSIFRLYKRRLKKLFILALLTPPSPLPSSTMHLQRANQKLMSTATWVHCVCSIPTLLLKIVGKSQCWSQDLLNGGRCCWGSGLPGRERGTGTIKEIFDKIDHIKVNFIKFFYKRHSNITSIVNRFDKNNLASYILLIFDKCWD